MATVKSISANSTKNNGGSAVYIGTSNVLNNIDQSTENVATGSIPVIGDDTKKSIDSETFANFERLPIAQRLYENLLSGSNNPELLRSINGIETFDSNGTSTAYRAGYWNIYTGKWSTDPVVSYDDMHKSVSGTVNIDENVHVNRQNPGSLTFLTGSKNPVNQDYQDKTG